MHEPTRLSSFIMLLAKLSRAFLVGVFNTSDDCSQSQSSKPFKTMINIIAYPTTSHGIWRFIPHRGDYIPRSEAE